MLPSFVTNRIRIVFIVLISCVPRGYVANINNVIEQAIDGHVPKITYSYGKQETWSNDFPSCGGSKQSPIQIEMSQTEIKKSLPHFSTAYYTRSPLSMTITNDGRTVILNGTWRANERPYIYGGPLKGKYMFEEMQFHWMFGSEHKLGSETYQVEGQFMHYNKKYGSFSKAMRYPDGIAIYAILYKIDSAHETRNAISLIAPILNKMTKIGASRPVQPFPLAKFNLNTTKMGYVSYYGSMTYPPCSDTIWIIGVEILPILISELIPIVYLPMETGGIGNNRDLHPLNGRTVYYYPDRST